MPAEPAKTYQVKFLLPGGSRTILVAATQHIWDAALAAGINLPAMCHQGRCLTCAARIEGRGEVDQSDSDLYLPQDREAGFILPCTGKPRSDLELKTHQQNAMRAHRLDHGLAAPYA